MCVPTPYITYVPSSSRFSCWGTKSKCLPEKERAAYTYLYTEELPDIYIYTHITCVFLLPIGFPAGGAKASAYPTKERAAPVAPVALKDGYDEMLGTYCLLIH